MTPTEVDAAINGEDDDLYNTARPGAGGALKVDRLTVTMERSLRRQVVKLARRSERTLSNYVRTVLWDHVNNVEWGDDDEEAGEITRES